MSSPNEALNSALERVDEQIDQSLERLFELLRIPSVSTDPRHATDCVHAADWLCVELSSQGFQAECHPTAGHPIVLARTEPKGPNATRLLFYGHYDVQPADPLELWDSDPFDPTIVEASGGRKQIRARGASDDKGQLLTFVEACRVLKAATQDIAVEVTILLEGEEESGSANLPAFLKAHVEELKSDVALICDTDMWNDSTPMITTMLRGFVAEEIVVSAASRDLHSGLYGGAARNPNQVLANVLDSLRNSDGSVAIDGFYEDVAELPENIKGMWSTLDFDGSAFLADVGLSGSAGEDGRTVMEQIISRPTCEINGMSGGYTGEGFKTVIPAEARSKISFRLVANQDPDEIRNAFRKHVQERIPADCRVEFRSHGAGPAISVPTDGALITRACQALKEEWGKEAVIGGSGGSIPVVGEFKRILDMETLLIGFARNSDNIHSPNEKYDLESFRKGIRSWVRILSAFAE